MKQRSKESIPSDLGSRFANLSPAKRTVLQQRLKEKGLDSLVKQIIPRRAKSDSAPLSFSQQRLWFLDQYEPNSSVYNIPSALRLRGPLDIGALEQSLNEIIRRHEILRTTFSMLDGEPVQVIAPSLMVSVPVIDLRDHPEGEREQKAEQLANEEARQPFDLAQGPLFRSKLLRLGEDDYVLLLAMHHIVSDGWSMGVFYRELSLLYGAFSHGEPNPLEDLAIQYADFAVWQREWLQGEVLEKQLSYWKNQLEGIPGVLHLPTDHPRPAVQSYRGARRSILLSRELTEGLKALSRREGVTLFMTLLAAFQTLLYRYTGQQDIVVGSPIANRNRTEIEGLIGFFVNTLVLRTNFSGNPMFKELLAQVREMALGAYAHQDLPFEKLVEELKPERSLSYSPLFQVMFVLQNARGTAGRFEGLRASRAPIGTETAKFDLLLSIAEDTGRLRGSLQYSTDLFEGITIDRLLGHFQIILEGVIGNPDQRISNLPLLTQAEQHQLLLEWNDTQRDYPKDKCIHELFEAQVEKSPDAVAVTFEEQQLTYRELNARANQLARYLRKLGVGPDVLVAICVERSLEMMVGLLGILKAGGAYVPLDPEYPKERLALMLEDAQPAVLLIHTRLMDKLPNRNGTLVCLDRDWEQISKETEENTENKASADNMAYVIYTSGTTGQPKGVVISHHNISRLFRVTEAWFHFSNNDVWTMFHSYAFDFSVWEIWGALLYGGRVVILPFWISRSPKKFYELLGREKVTVLNQTPSAFRQLIHADQLISEQNELALRLIIFGGEALDFQSLQPWLDRYGDQHPQLVNMYGITETTVHATYRVIKSMDVRPRVGSLIGVPLPDLDLYVLDKHRQLVPVGIPGELYIGGAGVGRGYLNRPELTDERFVLNPFNGRKTEKLYKTGDIVRRLPNGDIEYLGRTDAQIKLRGYRIELGEIESVLGQHLGVGAATVLAREDNPGDKRLVAYVVPRQEAPPTLSELRRFLKEKLPDYMVPSAFVFLDALPLTSNGKVDRKALPAPDGGRPKLIQSFVAPRTPIEERLAGIWSKLLGLNQVGVRDNFFDLGGHSLLAVRLFAEIEKAFNRRAPLSSLFQDGTIEHLAKIIDHRTPLGKQSCLVPIQPIGDKIPFFCVHEFFGDVLCYMNLARHLGPDQPFYAIEARGLDGVEEPFTDIKTMAAHYIQQIQAVQPEGPYALGGLCFGGVVAFEMAQQLRAKRKEVAMVALLDSSVGSRRNGKVTYGLSFLGDRLRDLPSWLIGSFELNRSQWLNLVKLKIRMGKARRAASRSSAVSTQQTYAAKLIEEMGDLFHFSEHHRRVARAQHRALRKYTPQVYPHRLTLFRARMQPLFSSHNPDKGWGRLAAGGLDIRVVPGNHLGMLQEPHVKTLAKELRACLEKANRS